MIDNDPNYLAFLAALDYCAEKDWKRKNYALAYAAGISAPYLVDILKRRARAAYKKQESLAKACGYEYEDFLELGRSLMSLDSHQRLKLGVAELNRRLQERKRLMRYLVSGKTGPVSTDDREHTPAPDPARLSELAGKIMRNVLALEGIDPNALEDVDDYIRFKLAKYDRRKGERRKARGPDGNPAGKERRQGGDRRASGT